MTPLGRAWTAGHGGRSRRAHGLLRIWVLATLFFVLSGVAGPVTARADSSDDEAQLVQLTTDVRADVGLPPLIVDPGLYTIASHWVSRMRNGRFLAHNRRAPQQIERLDAGWWIWGENVGYGPTAQWLHDAWMNSPEHYANIVEPAFTHFAVAVATDDDGYDFAVVLFAG